MWLNLERTRKFIPLPWYKGWGGGGVLDACDETAVLLFAKTLLAFEKYRFLFYRGYLMAKLCNGRLMKEHCEFERPPPRDHFNPFCKGMKDPPYPRGGAADNARTSMVFFFVCLVFVLFFQ